jgi:hypothetical protein
VTEITGRLERYAMLSKRWARRNAVEFDVAKMEAILFSRKTRRRRSDMTIDVGDGTKVPYNKGATRWLGFSLDSGSISKNTTPRGWQKQEKWRKASQDYTGIME